MGLPPDAANQSEENLKYFTEIPIISPPELVIGPEIINISDYTCTVLQYVCTANVKPGKVEDKQSEQQKVWQL